MHILSPITDNCPSWISGRERMVVEFFFMTKSPRKNVSDVRIEPATVCLPGRTRIRPSKRARPQRHLKAWNKWGLSPQKHLQISIQVNVTLIACKMIRDGFSCILGFQNFPGGGPRTTLQEQIHGEILDLIILSNLCATPTSPPPSSYWCKTRCYLLGICLW